MSYTGRNPAEAPNSESAVRSPASGPESTQARAMEGSASRTSAGSRRRPAVRAVKPSLAARSGRSPWTIRYQTSSKLRFSVSSIAEY